MGGRLMLIKIQQLHASIVAGLDEMDILTAMPQPAMDRLSKVRVALTRASRARTLLLEPAYEELIARAPSGQHAALRALRAEGTESLIKSVRHIGTWTLREVTSQWPEYCIASKIIRAEMRARVRKEAALLYPMLSDMSVTVIVA